MPWTIDESSADYHKSGLTKAEQSKYDDFKHQVHQLGKHPKKAAEYLGQRSYQYKQLMGDQYQIRVGGKQRVTFTVNSTSQTVKILQVGGHT